jgi:hypothetical protein
VLQQWRTTQHAARCTNRAPNAASFGNQAPHSMFDLLLECRERHNKCSLEAATERGNRMARTRMAFKQT